MDRLLVVLAGAERRIGLSDLSRLLHLPKATVHRIATELAGLGYLEKREGAYELGWRMYEIGHAVPEVARLRDAAMPCLLDLKTEVRAFGVHLSIQRKQEIIYLERLAGRREIALLSRIGMRERGVRTASGRLFAAYADRSHSSTLEQTGLTRATLDTILAQRWASEEGECVPGLKTYAVPIHSPGSAKIAAVVSASVPLERPDNRGLVHALWTTAREVRDALSTNPS